jgi:hypothetical protein
MPDAAGRRIDHLERARMFGAGLPDGVVLSHESAAIVHGLATYDVPAAVRLTGNRIRSTRTSDAHLHRAQLRDHDVTTVGEIPVTSLARTAVDLGRRLPFGQALVTADAALRAGCLPRDLADVLRHQWTWPCIRRAMPVVRHADPNSESALESVVRGRIILLRLPTAKLQTNLFDGPRWIARSDFDWPELNLVGEADGRSKYLADELWAEKERQDLIEDSGRVVIRWTWRTAHVPDDVFVARFRRYEQRGLLLRRLLRAPTAQT